MGEDLEDRELTGRIIGEAIEVHKDLGPGFLESIYEEDLSLRLELVGLPFERQKRIEIVYLGRKIGEHRLDLLVNETVAVELKAIRALEKTHFSTVRSYMKAIGTETGLLLNFSSMPLTIKRVGREKFEEKEIDDDLLRK
ncbi:MAG: GxxExxY protein [Planctomycetota bacterium]|jgi:GxxExxY protein